MSTPICIAPQGGRLCRRAVADGSILIGLMHLPEEFVPVEGVAYALQDSRGHVRVDTTAIDKRIPPHMHSFGLGDLLRNQIWNKTQSADVMSVRFLQGLPQGNSWTVYGASHHKLPDTHPGHAWFDIQDNGALKAIEAPFEAMGEGLGQMLTSHPVWPDRQGQMHTLSQTQTPWRAHYQAYHEFLAKAWREQLDDETLGAILFKNPVFRELHIGRVDRQYCQFLARLQDEGLLVVDGARTEDEHRRHKQACAKIISELAGITPAKSARPGP